jgi:DNA-binding GntR family transcriptional regulator
VRAVLEGLAVRMAIERGNIGAAESAHLERLAERMKGVEREPVAWLHRHDALHDYLCGRSESQRLTGLIRNVRQSVQPDVRVFLSVYPAEMPGAEHRRLLAVIAEGDPAAAEQAMREHVASAATAIVSFLKRLEGEPSANVRPHHLDSTPRRGEAPGRRKPKARR